MKDRTVQANMPDERAGTLKSKREHAALRWAARRLGRIDHERRVLHIAQALFDLTSHLHKLGSSQQKLLRLACVLHDVGRSVDAKSHPLAGARMIARDRSLPVSRGLRRRLCYLTRYHRGAVPEKGYDDWLKPSDDHKAIRRVLALLRAADALDNRNLPASRIVLARRGKTIVATLYLEEDSPKARRAYRRRKKFRLLEQLLSCRIEVAVSVAHAVQAVV